MSSIAFRRLYGGPSGSGPTRITARFGSATAVVVKDVGVTAGRSRHRRTKFRHSIGGDTRRSMDRGVRDEFRNCRQRERDIELGPLEHQHAGSPSGSLGASAGPPPTRSLCPLCSHRYTRWRPASTTHMRRSEPRPNGFVCLQEYRHPSGGAGLARHRRFLRSRRLYHSDREAAVTCSLRCFNPAASTAR